MTELLRTEVSLRFFGDALNPNEITKVLGATPTHADIKGQRVDYPPQSERVARTGNWRLHAQTKTPGNLDAQISEIFSKLTDDLSIWKRLTENYDVDLFCGLFMDSGNDGVLLSPNSLTILSERGVEIGFDIYQADES